mgnify:FL=1
MLNLEMLSDNAQAYFDEFVINGTDDELFASGYLRGHVDLVIGQALVAKASLSWSEFVEQVEASLNKAIKQGELAQDDIGPVNLVLNQLIHKLG